MMAADGKRRVLIAGASGVVGQAALDHFSRLEEWEIVAVSRRRPRMAKNARVHHLALDLTDKRACRDAVAAVGSVSHLVYAALYEKPNLTEGWRDPAQMQTNLAMLRNLLTPLAAGGSLRHVSLLQGTKAYGVHLHPIAVPARESAPRHPHDNFYWLQEDYLRDQAARAGFAMTIFRPQVVFGDVAGVAMNLIPVLGAYAAIRREAGKSFAFPGGPSYLLEAVDARLLARALAWAAEAPEARNETFNITNGDVFVWQNVWPAIAETLGVGPGPDEPVPLSTYLPENRDVWRRIAEREGLREPDLLHLIGQSHQYADFCFAYGARRPPAPALVSTIKLRQAGFGDCIDTEVMFRDLIRSMQDQRILPPA
jgi:nucleoside-diphosphate-sugar epimerase